MLDICCGTGAVTRTLAVILGAESVVWGLDFSWGMLARGRLAAEQAKLSTIRWVQADASALPFKAGSFDVATCAYALYELKGAARGEMLREVARVLSPGGRFLAMEHEVPSRPLSRLLFFLRLAVIGAEGARSFLGGEMEELGRIFPTIRKEQVPPGRSKILIGSKTGVESRMPRPEAPLRARQVRPRGRP